jgi:hypothetical protein
MGETVAAAGVDVDDEATKGVDRSMVRVLERMSQRTVKKEIIKHIAHCSGGRLEDLRFAACIKVDMTVLSTLCAAQMEEIDSSKEEGSSTSAGTKFFKSSTVEAEVDVEVGGMDLGSKSGNGVARDPVGGVSNLTAGFVYGRGRLCDGVLRTGDRCKAGNSPISIQVFNPHDQTPVLLETIATEREPLASNELVKSSQRLAGSPGKRHSLRGRTSSRLVHPRREGR